MGKVSQYIQPCPSLPSIKVLSSTMTRNMAIGFNCFECQGGSMHEARHCDMTNCPFHQFRKSALRSISKYTEPNRQREGSADHLKRAMG